MRQKPANSDAAIAEIAARQHGVATQAQLAAAGVKPSGISRRVKAGRLHRVHRGVYAVGHARITLEGRYLAAVLACGDRAFLSHRSAAALWGIFPVPSGPIDVTVAAASGRTRRKGIEIHRSRTLAAGSTTRHRGVPVTAPARTLRDLRRDVSAARVQKAVRRAMDLGLVTPAALDREPDLTRSELERLFLRLCRRHRIPDPEVNVRVERFEVDFLWREDRLVAETDGFRYHSSRAAFEADRARDAELQALGLVVLRFTYRQVRESPRAVAATLRSMIGRRDTREPSVGGG